MNQHLGNLDWLWFCVVAGGLLFVGIAHAVVWWKGYKK